MDISDLTRDMVTTNTTEVEIPGRGTVTIRGISRFEFMLARKKHGDDQLAAERFLLSLAIVDPAGLTEDHILAWQKASGPSEINDVAMRMNELSGIGPGGDKESYKSPEK